MKIVRKRLPKTQMNSPTFKVFTDEAVLFNKRIYSPFGLSLKCIKLRDTLNNLLTTFGIYEKANKFRDMYEAFIKIGSILNSSTMKEIAESQRFPEVVGLLGIERKYGDLLTEKDMTGIEPKERRTTKLRTCDLHFDDISEKTSAIGKRTTNASIFNQIEGWPIAKSLLCHFSALYLAYVLCYAINSWIPFSIYVILIFTLIFIIVYFITWFSVFISIKIVKKRLNDKLK